MRRAAVGNPQLRKFHLVVELRLPVLASRVDAVAPRIDRVPAIRAGVGQLRARLFHLRGQCFSLALIGTERADTLCRAGADVHAGKRRASSHRGETGLRQSQPWISRMDLGAGTDVGIGKASRTDRARQWLRAIRRGFRHFLPKPNMPRL